MTDVDPGPRPPRPCLIAAPRSDLNRRSPLPLGLVALLVPASGCSDPPPADPPWSFTQHEVSTTLSSTMANEASVAVHLVPDGTVSLVCDGPDGGAVPERHVLQSVGPAADHELLLRGLLADTPYACTITGSAEGHSESWSLELTTGPLPELLAQVPLPTTVYDPDRTTPGFTAINLFNLGNGKAYDLTEHFLTVVDLDGRIRWYVEISPDYAGDVAFEYYPEQSMFLAGGGYGMRPTLYDLSGALVTDFPSFNGYTVHHHAALADGSIWSLVGESIDGGEDAQAPSEWTGFCIQEQRVEDGSTPWTWCASVDGYAAGYLPAADVDGQDTYHANAIVIDDAPQDDGSTRRFVYVSLRNLARILKIDYETREVVWQLGADQDFTLVNGGDADWFYWLHDIHKVDCPDGSSNVCLLLYDNGKGRPTDEDYSRAVLMELDETEHTATLVREYLEENWYEPIWGGIELVNDTGNWLVGKAHNEYLSASSDSSDAAVVEVAPEGDVVWRLETGLSSWSFYRARRIDGCDLFSHAGYCPELEESVSAQ